MTPESDKDTHVSISDTMLGVIDEEIRTAQLQLCDESEARLCTVGVIDTLPSGLHNMVLAASDRIVSLAPQLIENVTSNLVHGHPNIL